MTENEILDYLNTHYSPERKGWDRIPYWKIKHPPNWNEVADSCDKVTNGTDSVTGDYHRENARLQTYWKERAKALVRTPNATAADILAAMEGVKTDTHLTELLKDRLKRASGKLGKGKQLAFRL